MYSPKDTKGKAELENLSITFMREEQSILSPHARSFQRGLEKETIVIAPEASYFSQWQCKCDHFCNFYEQI